jgi:hypothetical protein
VVVWGLCKELGDRFRDLKYKTSDFGNYEGKREKEENKVKVVGVPNLNNISCYSMNTAVILW